MRKRMLALLLAFAMLLGMMPATALPARAEETVTPPFASITTADGEAVSYEFKGMVPAATSWAEYDDGPYYHVTIPAGTESVLVTYPAEVGIAGAPSAFTYTLSVPDYTLGYGSAYLDVASGEDGSSIVTIPVADYLLTDGSGTAVSMEAEGSFDPITFFSFSYAQEAPDPEPSESEEPHSCSFDQQVTTEDYLATAANCTDAATYYYSCECGKAGTQTFVSGYKLGHSYENNICSRCGTVELWSATTNAAGGYVDSIEMIGAQAVSSTYSADSSNSTTKKSYYVDVKVAEDTASDEELTFTVYVGGRNGAWVYYKDADQASYSNDNGVLKLSDYNSNERYVRSGEIVKSLKDGKLEFSLKTSISGKTSYWYITVTTDHTCVFDQKVASEDYLATEADCTNAATYYYSCSCGEKGTQTFADGEALGHSYENGVCTSCGDVIPTITAYVYYATRADGIVTGKDGTVLNYVPVTVTDADSDGTFTMSDAFYALHEAYYEGGAAAGYENDFLIKFWGGSLSYGQFERNGNNGVYSTTGIEDGDMIAVTAGFGYNSLWTHFAGGMDGLKDTATAKKAKTFHVTAYQANGAAGNVTLPVGATVTATCGDTTLTTTVDEKGAFTLTFPTAGEYTVLVDGTSEVNGVKCSVIPARMTVTVGAAPYTVTLPEGEGYTVTGATTVAAGEDYSFTVTITDGEEYVVKVNGKTVVSDEDGVYTVENVSEDLVIAVTEFSKIPQQDSTGTYLIENGYQLKWFADQVNGGEYEMDAKLVSDIDLSVVCGEGVGSWTPIGHAKDNAQYQGTFDGQGYTISNLYMYETGSGTDVATYYRGLFGQVQAGTTIKNVNLTGSIYTTLRMVGGLVGRVGTLVSGDVTIDNCHVSVDIESDSSLGSVGGIAGQLREGTVSNCSYSGTIKTGIHTSVGGILGNTSTMSGTVSGCLFTGSITSSGGYWEEYGVGGIVGCAGSGTYTITNCASLGSIKASLLNVGGIVGTQYRANVTITNCYNAGTSDASGVVGGILGQITTGGRKTNVADCYYLDTFATTDAAGGSAKTAEAMKRNTMVILLGDGFKKSNGTVNGGYPGLSWQKYEAPALPESLDVTLSNGDGYTLSGDCLVAKGDSYTVTIDIELGYETDDTFAIQANGVAMTNNGDGSFTLSNAEEALTITVEGVVKSANAPVNITLTPGDGYTLTGETRVAYGSDYRFTLEIDSAYGKAETFAVKANGEPLTAGEDGSYTIKNLTKDMVITVEGVLPAYTVKVNTSAAYTLSAYEGYAEPTRSGVKLLSNQDYKFIVTPNEGYGVRDNNYDVSSGTNVKYSYEVEGDHAVVTVSYQKGDGTISISGIKKIMKVTVPEDAGYTIIPGEDVADMVLKGETYRFTLELTDGYRFGNGAAVKAGNTVLTANDEGVYSFQVNADTTITVTGVEKIPTVTYTVTLPTSGNAEGHAVSGYSNVVGSGGTFKFTVEPKVGYQPGENFAVKANGETLTASNGIYTLENITSDVTITVEGMEKIIWEPVNVYVSMSHDDKYLVGKESEEVMALRKISVPYFDLGLYGLESFYFQSETYGSDGGEHSSALEPGTAQYAYGKITLLHLYIYSLEVYYCGIDENEAGKGYLYEQGLIGTDVLTITGSVGSLYMSQFWGGDENLNYYVNYQYPLASAGWGSTSDQILLRENDVITLGHFTSWNFFSDPSSVFNYLTPDEENQVYGSTTVTQGDTLTLTAYRAGAGESGNYATGHTVLTTQPTIYYTGYDDVDADFENWTELGKAGAEGTIEIDTTGWEPGTYVVAMAGQYGTELTDVICSTPGGILVVVEEEKDDDVTLGDVDGDGEVNAADVARISMYLKGKTTLNEDNLAAADVNGDGKVNAADVTLIRMYLKGKLKNFSNAE